jgi:hypothetical protein
MHQGDAYTGADPPEGNREGMRLISSVGGVLSALRAKPIVVKSTGTGLFPIRTYSLLSRFQRHGFRFALSAHRCQVVILSSTLR